MTVFVQIGRSTSNGVGFCPAAGHIQNYQRFSQDGITYLVSAELLAAALG
jgi:hypothetical protein